MALANVLAVRAPIEERAIQDSNITRSGAPAEHISLVE